MKHTLLLSASAAFLLSSCTDREQEKPNILWITCEDISPAWGCYGDSVAATPQIDALAQDGYIFTRAYSNAPICAPARSTLISGMYATSLGTQNLRSEIPMPADFKILPEYLMQNGYYTTNNSKTDYNFSAEGRWHENSNEAHWRKREEGQPFFSVFNFGITHEGNANSQRTLDSAALVKVQKPEEMVLPPYFPGTDEFKSIMAHQYNLISLFDHEVGKLVDQLKEDGLYENTIIFVFSDHGFGLPRHKRWLYQSGTRVPFVMHVPEKYKSLVSNLEVGKTDRLTAFVDFAPTVLQLAGTDVPEQMQGVNFLGAKAKEKLFVYGYRDRADDVYDMSRSINTGRYRYIRNFMPHKAYIQDALIFNAEKRSYQELRRLKAAGELSAETMQMFQPKAVEELYDIQNDPYELNNLIHDPAYKDILAELSQLLTQTIIKTHDSGLLNEGEMMVRAKNTSVYEMTHDTAMFNASLYLKAAEMVGKEKNSDVITDALNHEDPGVRFWAMHALLALDSIGSGYKDDLSKLLDDPSVPNAVLAAEILLNKFDEHPALGVLKNGLVNDYEPVALQAAIATRNTSERACDIVPFIREEVYPRYAGNVWGRYRSWSYPMFIGMALDQTYKNCGLEIEVQK